MLVLYLGNEGRNYLLCIIAGAQRYQADSRSQNFYAVITAESNKFFDKYIFTG
jgi:hypothetical protein